jgi:hypothetical protein
VFAYACGLLVLFERASPRGMLRCASVVNASCRGGLNEGDALNNQVQAKEMCEVLHILD